MSRDFLCQLAMLAGPDDVIVSVGPSPQSVDFGLPIKTFRAPMGLAALAGRGMSELAGECDVIHAWTPWAATARPPLLLSLAYLDPADRRLKGFVKKLTGATPALTVPTEVSRKSLIAMGAPDEAVYVLPPAAQAATGCDKKRREFRKRLGVGEDEFLIAAPGEINRYSGHEYASWVCAILRRFIPRVRLVIPGVGPGFRKVESFVASTGFADVQQMTGNMDGIGIDDVLCAADMAVFFHQSDCGVSALAAAMAHALPIVACRTPDIAQCAPDKEAALLVRPKDPREASAAVAELINNSDLAKSLAETARQRAERYFDPKKCREKLHEIYRVLQ